MYGYSYGNQLFQTPSCVQAVLLLPCENLGEEKTVWPEQILFLSERSQCNLHAAMLHSHYKP